MTELDLKEQVAGATGITGTKETEPTPRAATTEAETKTKEGGTAEDKTQQTNPMKEIRTRYEAEKQEKQKYQSLLTRIADQKGISVDDLEKQIQEEEDKKTASAKGIPVDLQKQMRELQERSTRLEEDLQKRDFQYRLEKFQNKFPNLTKEEVVTFAEKAGAMGINILTTGVDLEVLYRSINYDVIMNKEREAVRQSILQELQGQRASGPSIQTIAGATTPKGQTQPSASDAANFVSEIHGAFKKNK